MGLRAISFLLLLSAPTVRSQPFVAGVLNGASFDAVIAPGALLSIFGQKLAPNTETAQGLPLPYKLQGTTVEISGIAAPLYFVSEGQINLQVPFEVSLGSMLLVVHTASGFSTPYSIVIKASASGVFSTGSNGKGRALMFDTGFQSRDALNPGGYVILYATGLGATVPQAVSGAPGSDSEPFNRVASVPDLYIGDTRAQILFAGLAPGFVGVYQVNAKIPDSLPTDRIFFRLGNTQSNAVSFAQSYSGIETVYAAYGPAVGTTFDFDGGVSTSARSIVQNGVGLAASFYQSVGLGDPGTTHIFALTSSEAMTNVYARWNQIPVDLAARGVLGSTAVSGPGVIYLNAAAPGWTNSPLQTKIIAHECFHVLQFKLAPQGIGVPEDQVPLIGPRWLIEGSAEYMGYKTVAASDLVSFSAARSQQVDQARRISVPLKTLETLPGIQALGPSGGYPLMFMAVDFIAAKLGMTPFAKFWTAIGQGTSWQDAFRMAFGETVDQFYVDFENYRSVNLQLYSQILGTVTNSSGNPFPGISVYACAVNPPGSCGYALTDGSGRYAIRAPDGGHTVSFGRSTDGNNWDGFYSSQGFVTDPSKATVVLVHGTDVSGIGVQLPF